MENTSYMELSKYLGATRIEINLSKYTSKTTTTPKLQEVNTIHLFYCLFKTKNIFIEKDEIAKNLMFKCDNTVSLKNKDKSN